MDAQQLLAAPVTNLDAMLKQAHQHDRTYGGRAGGVAAVVDAHATVVIDGALFLGEELHARQGQRLQVDALLLEHCLHLATL